MTYQIALLCGATRKDENCLGAATGSSLFELILRTQLANNKSITSDESLDFSIGGLWCCERGCSSQRSEKGGCEELHVEIW